MLDLPLPILPTTGARGVPPGCPSGNSDLSHPFALTLSRRAPADLMSGRAAPLVLARFATLADAMLGAIDHAEGMATNTAPQLLAIFDRDERLVVSPGDERHRSAGRGDRGEPAARAGGPRGNLG